MSICSLSWLKSCDIRWSKVIKKGTLLLNGIRLNNDRCLGNPFILSDNVVSLLSRMISVKQDKIIKYIKWIDLIHKPRSEQCILGTGICPMPLVTPHEDWPVKLHKLLSSDTRSRSQFMHTCKVNQASKFCRNQWVLLIIFPLYTVRQPWTNSCFMWGQRYLWNTGCH